MYPGIFLGASVPNSPSAIGFSPVSSKKPVTGPSYGLTSFTAGFTPFNAISSSSSNAVVSLPSALSFAI